MVRVHTSQTSGSTRKLFEPTLKWPTDPSENHPLKPTHKHVPSIDMYQPALTTTLIIQ